MAERFTDVVRSNIMDRRGEGVPVILSASRKLLGRDAQYKLSGDYELKLTIPSVPFEDPKLLEDIARNLSMRSCQPGQNEMFVSGIARICELIQRNPKVTQAEMAKGCGVSRTTITNWLKKAGGQIRREGGDHGEKWVVEG